jgi:diguanylate cyclase (GGDEF)-like protein
MERFFRPAASLLARLRFAHKFLVVGMVLAVPLAVVVFAYSSEQTDAVSASHTEQVGLRVMQPLLALSEQLAAARHTAATTGQATAVPAADIAAVDRTQRRDGASLGTAGQWQEVRQQLVIAGLTSGRATSLAAYDGVDIGLEALLVTVGNNSKLTVDPDLDASYLLDAVDVELPVVLDTTTRIVDQLSVDSRQGLSDQVQEQVQVLSQIGIAIGGIDGATAELDSAIETAGEHTPGRGVHDSVAVAAAVLDGAVSELDVALRNAELGHRPSAVSPAAAQPVAVAAHQLTQAATSAVVRLLRARVDLDTGRERRVELLAAAAALIALYLFSGFYFAVAGAVGRMTDTLRAVAAGRLDDQIAVTSNDELGYVAAAINDMMGKVRQATAQLAHDATHDGLTGLPNRSLIMDQLQRTLPRINPKEPLAVLFIDLDGFKPINDSLGHGVGDEVLRQVATRLLKATRPTNTVARLSGDEFLVVCPGLPDVLDGIAMASRMLDAIIPPMAVCSPDGEQQQVTVGASIGIAYITDPASSAEQLIGDADVAMYRAKERGRGRVEIFDEGLRADAEQRQHLLEQLRQAITEGEIQVHYQPIVELRSGRITGFEALARWAHPERGLLGPGAFMPTAESSGLIVSLGAHVLRQACGQLAAWQADPAMPPGLHMAVNLSARQLADHEIVDVVAAAVSAAGIDAGSLWLEITETALLTDAETATDVLLRLRESGIRLAVDDFGTGYSSLQRLKLFPLDVIKIDRSFVSGLGEDAGDEAIVRSVIGLANALGFGVVAEGVETPEQRAFLLELGCDLAQGFLFARPAPGSEITATASVPGGSVT